MLQISSYWQPGDCLEIDLLPSDEVESRMNEARQTLGKRTVEHILGGLLPKRLAKRICSELSLQSRVADLSRGDLQRLSERVHRWQIKPGGTEGMRTAEVTLGGVETR